MDSFNDVLDAAKAYCREHTADATYQYYISGLKAVSFENSNCITLEVRNDFICKIVSDRYTGLLKDAFKAVLGFDVEVKFTVPQPEPEAAKEKRPMDEASLPSGRYDFTFENFIKGPSNQFAYAAAQAVAANPSGAYNPLFIYGHSGLGKTHLMCAIINRMKENNPDVKITYTKGEDFTNQMISCLANKSMDEFRDRFRKCDALLIDDIQFIAGKMSIQEEFFHTFNALFEEKKQIILTSDRPPRDIKLLEDRLKSRFEWGLLADIEPPDLELRIAIIKNKAEQVNVTIPDDVLNFLGENLRSNIRQIEGAIKKLGALSFLSGRAITMDVARVCISELLGGAEPVSSTLDRVFITVTKKYGISREEMVGPKRNKEIANARHACIFLIRQVTDMSLPAIAKVFNRDHATIMSSLKNVDSRMQVDSDFLAELTDMKREIVGY